MKSKALMLAFAAFTAASTSAVQAQVETSNWGVGSPNILTYPAIAEGAYGQMSGSGSYGIYGGDYGACGASAGCGAPLFGRHTWFDDGRGHSGGGLLSGLFGGLLGGGWGGNRLGYGGTYGGGVNSLSAVVPNTCSAAAAPVCGQRLANSLFDIRLFGLGLGFGKVTPRWDARPAGWAL